MKKLKYVKTFESFKINEEVPYNYSVGQEFSSSTWTPEERSDLERLGADEIGKNDALFIEKGGSLNVKITKTFMNVQTSTYSAESDKERSSDYWNTISYNDWKTFLSQLDKFMRDGGLRKRQKGH